MKSLRKGFKKFLWLFPILVILAISPEVIWSWVFGDGDFTIIPISSMRTYTKEELADLYWSNREELTNVAKIVLANEGVRQVIINNFDDDSSIDDKDDKRFFSEAEWEQVEKVFQAMNLYRITLSRRINQWIVHLDFGVEKVKGMLVTTTLFYFENGAPMAQYEWYLSVDELEHLEGNWYIGEHSMEYPER